MNLLWLTPLAWIVILLMVDYLGSRLRKRPSPLTEMGRESPDLAAPVVHDSDSPSRSDSCASRSMHHWPTLEPGE